MKQGTVKMLDGATATGVGERHEPINYGKRTFQLTGFTTSGAGAASVDIEASNDGANFLVLGSISLVLSDAYVSTDGFASDAAWRYIRANVTSISGTGAEVTAWLGA